MERKDPKEKKCAICGKDIYAGEEWAYKRREKSERTKWFCSYKCMRAWDAKHGPKQKKIQVDTEATAPKEPVSREVLARALVKEIKNGGSVIAYMKAEGYKNPWEAYNAVRHYAQTKMPELAEVLKPLKDLPKAPQAKNGKTAEVSGQGGEGGPGAAGITSAGYVHPARDAGRNTGGRNGSTDTIWRRGLPAEGGRGHEAGEGHRPRDS